MSVLRAATSVTQSVTRLPVPPQREQPRNANWGWSLLERRDWSRDVTVDIADEVRRRYAELDERAGVGAGVHGTNRH